MKIIDLLNKIANGEEVPNFIVDEVEYYMGENGYLRECMGDDTQWYIDKSWLNTEVEILEEEKKIPEKIEEPRFDKGRYYIKDINGSKSEISGIERTFRLKINEIIDYLQSIGE